TLLSSQGTDASFVLTLSGFPPGIFPSVFRVSSLADPIPRFCHPLERVAFREFALALSFPADPTLSESFRPT
ncbi:hypothetical protein, partial [Streptomyces sp. NPDC048577]|uniref:hypothetical protein n=1 Tax=Streptomyces sp. NPDC048577 TaxID=3157209 RepID=UPI00343A9373